MSGLGGNQWLGGEVLLCNNFFKDSIFSQDSCSNSFSAFLILQTFNSVSPSKSFYNYICLDSEQCKALPVVMIGYCDDIWILNTSYNISNVRKFFKICESKRVSYQFSDVINSLVKILN